jgi:Uma2 family endonuclease
MSIAPPLFSPPPPAIPDEAIFRLEVTQYHAMVQAGILTEDDPVELLEGWLVAKMPKNPAHRIATHQVLQVLVRVLPENWYADSQEPITTEDSEPEPDVMVVRGHTRDYADRHPGPTDVALVVEVADTTLRRDRTLKQRLYARAGIPEYWIVNLVDRCVEVYTNPAAAGYQHQQSCGPDEAVPVVLDGHEAGRVPVPSLLP